MPDYPSDYYYRSTNPLPPPVAPCPDDTCCDSPVGPASTGGGEASGAGLLGSARIGGAAGGCGSRNCFVARSPYPIRYATGAVEIAVNDLLSTGFGEPWGHTRTYTNRLFENGTLRSADEVNGRNWFLATSPYLVESAEGSDGAAIAVIGNVATTLWFDFDGSGPNVYVNRFHGDETLVHDDTNHVLRLASPDGSITEFHDFDQSIYPQGLFKRRISPSGLAIEVFYHGGEIKEVQRSATVEGTTTSESLVYTYEWYGRLSSVLLRRRIDTGPWRQIQRVDFSYWSSYSGYWNEPERGSGGDLRTAETHEWTGTAWRHTGTTFYTYYLQGEPNGFVFGLKHVLGPDAVARLVADGKAAFGTFYSNYYDGASTTLQVSSTADLSAYADNSFEYDGQRRVTRETVKGGTQSYQYSYVTSSHAAATDHWHTKTTETQPDGTELIVYSNAAGQTLLTVHRTAAGDWIEFAQYHDGHRILKADPSAVVSFDDAQGDLDVVLKTNDGLIELFEYSSLTDPIPNKLVAEKIQQGTAGMPILRRQYQYTSHTALGTTTFPITKIIDYPHDDGSGAVETEHALTWHSGTQQILQQTTTLPSVPTGQNGTGVAATRTQRFDLFGNWLWLRDERGVITRQKVNPSLGVVTQRINDVDTAIETDAPAGWATLPGYGLQLVTDYQFDDLGRVIRELGPPHTIDIDDSATSIRRATWTAYWNDRYGKETRVGHGFYKLSDFSQTLANPVTILKSTHRGNIVEEIQAIQGWQNGSSGSAFEALLTEAPLTVPGPVADGEDAFPQESYTAWTTHQYANCCELISSRTYQLIPPSGSGTAGTNYGQTSFGHDIMGRRNRVQSPGGTITSYVFDARGNRIETWIGTNDAGAIDDDPSGGGFDPENDMILLSQQQFDSGLAGGDGNLTQQTEYVDASTTRVTQYAYDWRNRQIEIDGELDHFQQTTFDNLDRVVRVERRIGSSSGQLLSRSDTLYDNRGRAYRTIRYGIDPTNGNITGDQTEDNTFDQSHHVLRQEPAGMMAYQTFAYDSLGRRISATNPLNQSTLFAFDAAGNAVSTTDANGKVWLSSYDSRGRLVRSTNPLNESTDYGYSAAGRQSSVSNPLEETTTSTFDDAGRLLSVADPLDYLTSYTYDLDGNQLSVTDPNSLTTFSEYDYRSRLVKVTDPGGAITRYGYNRVNELITETDAKNQDTQHTYDALGRRTSTTDRLNQTTSFGWNPLDLPASLTDAQSQTTAYQYDAFARLWRTTWPDHQPATAPGDLGYGITKIEYDALNRVYRTTDQLGDTVTHNYDPAGRLLSKDYRTRANSPSGPIADSDTFTYDPTSKLLSAVSGRYSNTVTRTYDDAGRKATESLTISGQTYTSTTEYDAAGRVSKLTYPDGSEVNRDYTARGQLRTLALGSSTLDTRSYDDGGRLISSVYANGIGQTRVYNNDNTLAGITFSGAAIGNLDYSWDANKNKTAETIGGVMAGYGFAADYDADDRLTSWQRADSTLDQSWNLSPVGNWNSFTQNTTTQTRTHSPANEILTAASQTVQHDAKGNTTLIPPALRPAGADPLSIKWDFDNRLRAADSDDSGTDDVFYRWDALGRRVGRDDGTTSVVYFQDDQQTLADYVAGAATSSPTYRYLLGSYIDEVVVRLDSLGNSLYYHANQQYSIIALTDGSGSIIERYAYTAYGQLTITDASGTILASSPSNNRYTYTGREWDAVLRLYHFRARMYDPLSGRFLSRDPIGYWDGMSLYRTHHVPGELDPTGMKVVPWVNPPNTPFTGRTCMLKWRCWDIVAGFSHCGIVMSLDGSEYSIDGTGGSENHFNWPAVPILPVGVDGYPQGYYTYASIETCECLRAASIEWNSNDVPRGNHSCNSNTSLRCLAGKCNIQIDFGSRGKPYRYDADCRICVRKQPCGKQCAEWKSICEQGFSNPGPDTPLPSVNLPSGPLFDYPLPPSVGLPGIHMFM